MEFSSLQEQILNYEGIFTSNALREKEHSSFHLLSIMLSDLDASWKMQNEASQKRVKSLTSTDNPTVLFFKVNEASQRFSWHFLFGR